MSCWTACSNGGVLPMITSCSPGWIKFCEHYYPRLHSQPFHLQIAPRDGRRHDQELLRREGRALIPRISAVVSVMPCTAKKFEAKRP